jgi:hypothetical protein
MATARARVRVGGSAFTIFTFRGQPLAFCQQVSHTTPQPVGPGPVAIQPMDEPAPVQVITAAAAGMGSLTLNMIELYGSKVWDRLGAEVGYKGTNTPYVGTSAYTTQTSSIFNGAVDITDIMIRVAEEAPEDMSVVKYIRPPKLAGDTVSPYSEIYHNCVIMNVLDGEQVEIGTMEVIKQITVGYTHMTQPGRGFQATGRSKAFWYRDRPLA